MACQVQATAGKFPRLEGFPFHGFKALDLGHERCATRGGYSTVTQVTEIAATFERLSRHKMTIDVAALCAIMGSLKVGQPVDIIVLAGS
jgi:hypothetical protein